MTKILEQPVDRYPLAWPVGWPRTAAAERKPAPFFKVAHETYGTGDTSYQHKVKRPLTMAGAVERLMRECDRIGADGPVLSTNVQLRLDGLPRGDRPMPSDVGAALYFRHKGKPIVMACDRWSTVPGNIAAIAGHIEAIRAQDRYGVGRLEQALAGYQRLLSGRRAWFEVLGLSRPPANWEPIETAYKTLAKKYHPDRHHDQTIMTEINEAYQTAKEEFGR
jgi:hypothetical protein